MIGATIVFLCTVAIVATYILTVNRMLRTDSNWAESNLIRPKSAVKPKTPLPVGKLARA